MALHGNLTGLKAAQKKALERLGNRQIPTGKIINPEVASTMSLLSREIGRQLGVFVDRQGNISEVAVGDSGRILLPDFGRVRAGERRFRGLRFVHTHLKSEPLSRDDLTDLTRLRLDMIVAVGVAPDRIPRGRVLRSHAATVQDRRAPPAGGPGEHRHAPGRLPRAHVLTGGGVQAAVRRPGGGHARGAGPCWCT